MVKKKRTLFHVLCTHPFPKQRYAHLWLLATSYTYGFKCISGLSWTWDSHFQMPPGYLFNKKYLHQQLRVCSVFWVQSWSRFYKMENCNIPFLKEYFQTSPLHGNQPPLGQVTICDSVPITGTGQRVTKTWSSLNITLGTSKPASQRSENKTKQEATAKISKTNHLSQHDFGEKAFPNPMEQYILITS